MIYQDFLDLSALEQYAVALNARAKIIGAGGKLTATELRDRILASGGRCEWCGESLLGAEFELDHLVSLQQRGSNTPSNLAVACPDCNRRKSNKHPARYAAEIYNERGFQTDLVAGILQQFGISPGQQLPLFDRETAETMETMPIIDYEGDLPQIPPYRWSD